MDTVSKTPISFAMRSYFLLTKPGIIMGNAITTVSGFLLASKGGFDGRLFLATLTGLSAIIASACVFNNFIDKEADAKMARTQNRTLAKGLVSSKKALLFAVILGLVGTLCLAAWTNLLSLGIALLGFFVYVILYSFCKYHTAQATLIGSIAGAIPPVVGYTAVTNTPDLGALLLFAILTLWQMPHFFAIAIYRLNDYAKAGIPVLPVQKGVRQTKVQMLAYVAAFLTISPLLTLCGYTGKIYLAAALILSLSWLVLAAKGFKASNDAQWARKMFIFSLVVVIGVSLAIPFSLISTP